MKNSNLITIISLIVGLLITVFLYKLIETYTILKWFEIILLLVFPVVLTVITYLISTNDLKNLKTDIIENYKNYQLSTEEEIKELKNEITEYVDKNRFVCHGTKYGFPNRSQFWDNFLILANKKFILFGKTNHNWVSKGRDQSVRLGNSIIAILENDGIVKILSEDGQETIDKHKAFIEKYILDKIGSTTKKNVLLKKFKDNFSYKTKNDLNFTAVVSDDRLIILPRLNNEKNQDKCMVLEVNRTMEDVYINYSTDIENVFELAAEIKFEL